MVIIKFLFWFTLIPWVLHAIFIAINMVLESTPFGALGLILCWIFLPFIMLPLVLVLGFVSSWAWVFEN